MKAVMHRQGQSIYDLCEQTYGTLDYLVKFANDNGVTDLGNIREQIPYYYDETLVKYENNQNIYTTKAKAIAAGSEREFDIDDFDPAEFA